MLVLRTSMAFDIGIGDKTHEIIVHTLSKNETQRGIRRIYFKSDKEREWSSVTHRSRLRYVLEMDGLRLFRKRK